MSNVLRSSKLSGSENVTFIGSKNLPESGGIIADGIYTGKSERDAQDAKGKRFKSITYFFETEAGKVGINKLGNLQHVLEKQVELKEGERAIVEYDGVINGFHTFNASVMG